MASSQTADIEFDSSPTMQVMSDSEALAQAELDFNHSKAKYERYKKITGIEPIKMLDDADTFDYLQPHVKRNWVADILNNN